MKEYNEEDFLNIAGLQHFAFCRRQWALIHIEHIGAKESFNVEGTLIV